MQQLTSIHLRPAWNLGYMNVSPVVRLVSGSESSVTESIDCTP